MVSFRIDTFGGMIPAVDDEFLPPNAAALSKNTWLYKGSLVGLPAPIDLHNLLSSATTKVFRIPASYDRPSYLYNSTWLEFAHTDTDVIRAPVFGDVHDRYYWASPVPSPSYNTRARIEAGLHPWKLGVNPPGPAPDVTVAGGSTRLADVRVATIASGALATDFVTGKVIDGYTLKLGDRILIKDQAGGNAFGNGVRIVAASGAPTRATDMDTSNEFVGRYVKVLEGSANAGTFWKVTNTAPPVVNTTAINFEEISGNPLTVTRSYVYTWVTHYGEESAPSSPAIVTGAQDGTWQLSGLAVPDPLDMGDLIVPNPDANRYITKTRIYRTVTSVNSVATFFLVDEIPCTQTTYTDDKTDDEVTQNSLLESFEWTPPPSDLKGLTVMWNGMVAGFRENELWVCEPYRPHAWPASFVHTMEYPIVGLGVSNQTMVVCTAGNPVTVNGSLPDNITTAKVAKFEPCMSRRSILSSPNGVIYASPNGLIVVTQGGAINATRDLLTRDEWSKYAGEKLLRAAWFGEAYYAYGGSSPNVFEPTAFADPSNDDMLLSWVSQEDFTGAYNGVLIDIINQRVAFNLLESELPVFNVQNDGWSGELFIIRDGKVQWLDMSEVGSLTHGGDPTAEAVEPALWRSKIFQTPDKKNLGAMRVYFKPTPNIVAQNLVRNVNSVQTLADDQWGICRVYADGRLIMTRELRESGELWRLPSGFKADFWQYEIETRARVINVQIASTVKELIAV